MAPATVRVVLVVMAVSDGARLLGRRAVSPLRNLGFYAGCTAGANQLVGYPDELDVVVLGDPSHQVEGLLGVDTPDGTARRSGPPCAAIPRGVPARRGA